MPFEAQTLAWVRSEITGVIHERFTVGSAEFSDIEVEVKDCLA
jgi:hypothetical protein